LNTFSRYVIGFAGVITVLIYGQSILVPFIFALLLWFTIRVFTSVSQKFPVYGKWVPNKLKTIFTTVFIFSILYFFTQLILSSFNSIIDSHLNYNDNINGLINLVNEKFKIDFQSYIETQYTEISLASLAEMLFDAVSKIISSTLMILIFAIFIFLEETHFSHKLKQFLSESSSDFHGLNSTLSKIEWSVAKYLGIKTMSSFITGLLSFIVFYFCDLNFAIFWAFLIFILNYIPTIGSLLATLFPVVFSLLQFGDFSIALIILFVVGSIQVVIGNIIEPKWMGNSMNISPLVSILSLMFWGLIWGTTGMIVSVPFTVVIIIILSEIQYTRPLAILLSEKGDINERE
jgi:predicted PurR-regulated permease PerM|tara:strand:- start:2342 stop:3379 length:1038 start_codon:yes stop_codon:yes gene_type:complete